MVVGPSLPHLEKENMNKKHTKLSIGAEAIDHLSVSNDKELDTKEHELHKPSMMHVSKFVRRKRGSEGEESIRTDLPRKLS